MTLGGCRKQSLSCGLLFAICLLLLRVSLPGQVIVSTIRGSIADPSGAAVTNVDVAVVNIATNIRRSVVTNDNGDFEIPDLPAGAYRLTATHPGFKTFVADNIILESNQTRRIDVAFELGGANTEVTVRADAALINTETAKVQTSFTQQRFVDAPWVGDGRNPQTVFTTLPQVQATTGVYGIQLAGLPDAQVQSAIDGLPGDTGSLQTSNVQFMQEVVVVTGTNSAEYSRAGYISIVTKGGGNQFHGRALYWHDNPALSARSFFDTVKAKNLFHTMDAEISGPIRKDKTFFYFDWAGQRWPASTFYLLNVPTAPMRQGDFSQLLTLSQPVTIKDPTTGNPFPGNVIPTSRLNPTALQVLNTYIPAPNQGGANALSNNFGYLFPHPSDLFRADAYDMRVDHKISQKNTIFGRYIIGRAYYILAENYPGMAWTRLRNGTSAMVEDTHVFAPNLVNTFRFGLYEPQITDGGTVGGFTPLKGDQVVKALGIQGVNPQGLSAQGFPNFAIAGYSTLTIQPGGVNATDKNWDYADSLTWAKGSHVLKFGGEFRKFSNFSGTVPTGTYGNFNFTGSFTGYGVSDFLLGVPFTSQRLNPLTNRTQLDSETGLYVQDSYKVNARLTLDLGLRWERFGAANYQDGLIYNWDPTTGDVLVPAAALSKISPLYPTNTIKVVAGQAQQNPSLRNFDPRVGFAYRPMGDKFVIRGGYGLYTETLGQYARAQGTGPYQLTETFTNSIQGGQPLFAFPDPFPPGAGSVPSQSVTGFNPNTKNGQIHQFNLTTERQVRDIGLRVSYTGSRSLNLNYTIGVDKPEPSPVKFTQSALPYPQFVSASLARNNGSADYNAFVFEAQRKFGQVTFDGHWTWASNYNNMLNLENPYAPLFWSRDPSTVRHRVVINAVWSIPVGKGHQVLGAVPGAINQIVSGWQLYWVGYFATGEFFSPTFSGADPSGTNTVGGTPNRICNGNLPPGQRTVTHWFNASCFTVPTPGSFGNSGFNILEGPGLQLNNLSLGKTFRVTERVRFTFMAAAQNVLNHPDFAFPASNISAPGSVGVISSVQAFAPGRQIMLRGRVDF